MVCQDSKLGFGDYEGSSYNQNTVSWTTLRNGVLMQQADGAQCGTLGPRVTRAFFYCNASATTAVMYNVTEGPTCTYNMYVWTSLACPSAATTCGGAGYDITSLTARADLSYTNTAAGYTFYFSPCGVVQSSQCQSNVLSQSAMACQASITSNSTYNLAVYAPQVTTWTPLSNGVQMMVQDGSTCDNYNFERVFVANFLCGIGGQYQLLNVTEQTLCYYVAFINTGMSCASIAGNAASSSATVRVISSTAAAGATSTNRLPSTAAVTVTSVPATPGGGGGGSSGLSGGAIAGIVIGSVVGVVVLLGLLLLVCCRGGFGRGKSSGDDMPMGTAGTGKYGEFDGSDSSHIEMESTHGEAETHESSPEA